MEELRFTIAKNLIYLRKANHFTQAELADKLAYTDKTVSKWETGETEPSVDVLKQLADFYGITLDDIVSLNLDKRNTTTRNQKKYSRLTITLLGIFTIWLIATMGFSLSIIYGDVSTSWLLFVAAIPASAIVAIVFNSIWGRPKDNYIYISVLVWGLLLTLYLSCLLHFSLNLWPAFFVGVPAQIIIILWANIKKRH